MNSDLDLVQILLAVNAALAEGHQYSPSLRVELFLLSVIVLHLQYLDPTHRPVPAVVPGLDPLDQVAGLVRDLVPLHPVQEVGQEGRVEGAGGPGRQFQHRRLCQSRRHRHHHHHHHHHHAGTVLVLEYSALCLTARTRGSPTLGLVVLMTSTSSFCHLNLTWITALELSPTCPDCWQTPSARGERREPERA